MMRKVQVMMIVSVSMVMLGVCAISAGAGITVDKGNNAVSIVGFAEDNPATLTELRAADAAGKWGVTRYDAAQDTTTLSAHLWIGANDGSSSFLQIGDTEHPNETLITKGNLRVNKSKPKQYGFWEGRNGLIVGLPDNSKVKPVLKFDCSKAGEFGLKTESGTRLKCYNATITAASPDRGKGWKGEAAVYPGGELVLINTTLSYFSSLYPFETMNATVKGCTYEHGSYALPNGLGYYEDCTFRDLDAALSDGGALDCMVVNCRFEGNRRNWMLRHTNRGLRAVDCFFGETEIKEVVCQRWKNPRFGQWQYPIFFAQRHIVVAVKDEAGKRVAGAKITVTNEQDDLSAVVHGVALTGEDGKTPAPDAVDALLLADYLYRASEDPKNPIEKRYTYTVTVEAKGYATAKVTSIDPDQAWAVKEVTLKKQ